MKKLKKNLVNIDWLFVIILILIIILGLVAVNSATQSYGNPESYMRTQSISIFLGIVFIFIILSFDYNILGYLSFPIYIISNILLVAVLLRGTGQEQWGATRWLYIGGFGFQPSDFAKIGIIIFIAKYLSDNHSKINEPAVLLKLLGYIAVPMLLIFKQPDLGTTLAFPFFTISMLFIAGINIKYLLIGLISAIISLPIAWNFLSDYHKSRIMIFRNPGEDPLGAGYQINQSIYAVGSGMFRGRGLHQGVQNQFGYLPEKHNDFIFAVIAEELGFLVVSILILGYFIMLMRGIYIAMTSKDNFGCFLVIGITSMLAFHIFTNIAMTIGLMPVTGKPLPFISYGGTFMLSNLICVGIVLNVSMRRNINKFFNW